MVSQVPIHGPRYVPFKLQTSPKGEDHRIVLCGGNLSFGFEISEAVKFTRMLLDREFIA